MKVFVAGATGVVGRRAVRRLVEAGHEVTAVARNAEKAALVRAAGATPVSVDLFDPQALDAAVSGHEVVVNLATSIPPIAKAALPGAWAGNDRIRTEASRHLVDAAIAAGASRYVQESISFTYADGGDAWLDEDAPLDVPDHVRSTLDAEAQARRFTDSGGTGVVLRFGMFYAPDSSHTIDLVRAARNGVGVALGDGDGYASMVHADDAAAAVVAALHAPAGTYNVVEDEPLPRGEGARVLLEAAGRGRAVVAPGRAAARSRRTEMLARSQRVSNRRFREATGWSPRFASVREGWPAVLRAMGDEASWAKGPVVRLLLTGMAASALVVGLWAQLAPRSFYDSFPGGGRAWVSVDGPFNEHLARDVGGLNLALALVTVAALLKGGPAVVRVAAGAWLVYSVPHLAYHATHLGPYGTVDAVSSIGSLALGVAAPLVLLAIGRSRPVPSVARLDDEHAAAGVV